MKILGLSGSLREQSHNSRLLAGTRGLLPSGVELDLFERLADIPPYSEDGEHELPPAVIELAAALERADALLVATPEYNGSIPGHLKNALDWVSRPAAGEPVKGMPAAVLGVSTGLFGAVWAQAEMRKVLTTMGARVVDRELPIGQAPDTLSPDGLPSDEEAAQHIAATLAELVELAEPVARAA
jgi:chromate reductase